MFLKSWEREKGTRLFPTHVPVKEMALGLTSMEEMALGLISMEEVTLGLTSVEEVTLGLTSMPRVPRVSTHSF